MPLYPPPQPVEHPADLVIDVFGTFLGKRSERMVIRWRDAFNRTPDSSTSPSDNGSPSAAEEVSSLEDRSDRSAVDNVPESTDQHNTPSSIGSSDPPDKDPIPTANLAASQLLHLWARRSSGAESTPPTPLARLQRQLEMIDESEATPRHGNEWQERAVPISRLRSVTVSGRGVTISSDLISALVERGISLSFLSGRGDPIAQLSASGLSGTVQTRRSQLAAYETSRGVELAVEFIRGKLRNQKHQLQYSGKYLKGSAPDRFERLLKNIKALGALRKQLAEFKGEHLDHVRDKLMGYEGTGARIYWEGVSILLEGRVDFPGRVTRGALDPVNSALNYGYGILYGQVAGAVVNAGLELYAGFLHVDRPGKPSLVLDLVEEFRAPIVDRTVLAIANQGMSIEVDPHGLTPATKKLIAQRTVERLATIVPYEGKRWPLGAIIQHQARHLAVAVRGEREYRAFASRW